MGVVRDGGRKGKTERDRKEDDRVGREREGSGSDALKKKKRTSESGRGI